MRALPAVEDPGLAILLADASIDTKILNRVVLTCKRAGYKTLLLAVAKEGPTRADDEIQSTTPQIRL